MTLVIHLLNASRSRSPVDIQLFIDGNLMVSDRFDSGSVTPGGEPMPSIPPHRTYEFQLAPGHHTLRARSDAGEASFDTSFDLTTPRWALLGYEYGSSEKQFEFLLQDEPILFQ